jgi:hypothetical protein
LFSSVVEYKGVGNDNIIAKEDERVAENIVFSNEEELLTTVQKFSSRFLELFVVIDSN